MGFFAHLFLCFFTSHIFFFLLFFFLPSPTLHLLPFFFSFLFFSFFFFFFFLIPVVPCFFYAFVCFRSFFAVNCVRSYVAMSVPGPDFFLSSLLFNTYAPIRVSTAGGYLYLYPFTSTRPLVFRLPSFFSFLCDFWFCSVVSHILQYLQFCVPELNCARLSCILGMLISATLFWCSLSSYFFLRSYPTHPTFFFDIFIPPPIH